MTLSQMNPIVKLELSGLSRSAKQELSALLANKVAVMVGRAHLIAEDDRSPASARQGARAIDRVGHELMEELRVLLEAKPKRDTNAHLGSVAEGR